MGCGPELLRQRPTRVALTESRDELPEAANVRVFQRLVPPGLALEAAVPAVVIRHAPDLSKHGALQWQNALKCTTKSTSDTPKCTGTANLNSQTVKAAVTVPANLSSDCKRLHALSADLHLVVERVRPAVGSARHSGLVPLTLPNTTDSIKTHMNNTDSIKTHKYTTDYKNA